MKKVLLSICMVSAVFAMSSCGSTKEAASLSSLNGEWNIIEVNGSAIVPAENQELPFIGFDTATGKVYGNSGCNRMMGSIDLNSKPGTIDMSRLGSTRMACPDMTTEQNVLNALGQVKSYKKLGKHNMALCNASNRPVVVLQKKASDVKLSALNGEWKIEEVNGEAIPSGMEKQPFINFDVKKKSIHGNAGCNLINGGFETDKENPRSISFPNVISTMMACPDMEVEGKVMKAINEVKSFDVLSGGGIGITMPHVARGLFGSPNHRIILPASMLCGAITLLVCDLISQLPGMQGTLPINAVTALFGSPIIVWIILRNSYINK